MRRLILFIAAIAVLASACNSTEQPATTLASPTPAPGPARDVDGNLLAGLGWELLEFTRSGPTYSVAVAENERDVERMWSSLRFEVPAPAVDFDTHVLVVLGHAVSGSCPEIQFQGLAIEPDRAYGEFTFDHGRDACTADANPAAYLLAVERSALPDRFVLTLENEDICAGCDDDVIAVDLTSDEPDAAQWWAIPRFGVVIGGAPPVDSHVFVLRYGGSAEPLAIMAADWQEDPQWVTGGERIPDRVEAFTAACLGGAECIEDLELLEPTGPICGTNLDPTSRSDFTVMLTFAEDGRCEITVVEGTDGTEFLPADNEADT